MHSGEWRIGHTETRTYVFGEKFDGRPIGNRIGLRQILHSFDQQALPIHIARIGVTLASARNFRRDRNRENFSHSYLQRVLVDLFCSITP